MLDKSFQVAISLEGTLSDPSHRLGLRNEGFDDYHRAFYDDAPNEQLISFINDCLCLTYGITVYTMLPENLKPMVVEWIIKNNITVDNLILKKKTDYRSEIDIKLEIINSIDNHSKIVIENNQKVADRLREQGYFVIQI